MVSVAGIAVLLVVVLLALSGRYGYHRDELYFRVAGQHPAWGYVDQPFVTPMLARVGIAVFGDSPRGLRVFPALLAGSTVLIVALLARELRAGPTAQVLAALAAAVSAIVAQGGHMLSTPTTDVLAWLVISLLVVRMLRCAQPRWWVPIGLVSGLAVDNKLTVGILLGAIAVTLPAVGPRAVLRSWWLPVGAVLAVLVALPTIAWQVVQGFPQGRVASTIAGDDGFTDRVLFVPMQLVLLGPLIVPLCVAGVRALARFTDPICQAVRSGLPPGGRHRDRGRRQVLLHRRPSARARGGRCAAGGGVGTDAHPTVAARRRIDRHHHVQRGDRAAGVAGRSGGNCQSGQQGTG